MERNSATEDDEIAEIVRGFLVQQARAAAEENRPLCRGTHAKGVCVRAVFEVLDVTQGREPSLGARLAKGLYATPASYPATVRFANSDPSVNTDWEPDVRGLSFAVELASSGMAGAGDHVGRQDTPAKPPRPASTTSTRLPCWPGSPRPTRPSAWRSRFADQSVSRTRNCASCGSSASPSGRQQLRLLSNVPFRHGPE
jgi:hypothetical protein